MFTNHPTGAEAYASTGVARDCAYGPLALGHAHLELVIVGQRLERREVRLEQRLVGQAAIGDHIETSTFLERARRRLDHALAERRRAGAAGVEGRVTDYR